jgi:hypothetical protein
MTTMLGAHWLVGGLMQEVRTAPLMPLLARCDSPQKMIIAAWVPRCIVVYYFLVCDEYAHSFVHNSCVPSCAFVQLNKQCDKDSGKRAMCEETIFLFLECGYGHLLYALRTVLKNVFNHQHACTQIT